MTLTLAAFCLFKVEEERTEGSARPPRALATTSMAFDGAKILINASLCAQTEVLIQERKNNELFASGCLLRKVYYFFITPQP